jgi:starch-binding outer membrane protein, SusD/RagB family
MKIKYILFSSLMVFLMSGCNDFLDTDNLTKKDNSNFPKTKTDAEESLTGCYSMLRDSENPLITSELLSDERFGGGGPDDRWAQAVDHLMKNENDMFSSLWAAEYAGIYRCNMLLERLDKISFSSDDDHNRIEGETYFLRAYYYLNLGEFFGSVPLITTSTYGNYPQASADSLFVQIGEDLVTAIKLLPSTKIQNMDADNLGHATKWAAEGLLARAFLFYTGYYNKTSMGSVTKDIVVADLNDCIANSGHKLMPDFRNLWSYSNQYTATDYIYDSENGLSWYGDDGGNLETIFSIKFSPNAMWDGSYTNRNNGVNLTFSPRETDGSVKNNFPLGIGWGFGPISSVMINDWKSAEPNDTRFKASIFDVSDEAPDYIWGADKQMNETGYWQKKNVAIDYKTSDGTIQNISHAMYPNVISDYQLDNIQDIVVLRFADILLMQSELTQTVNGINDVRTRVGLKPIAAYSDQALQNERRWELAFEGQRWFDLLRWHKAGDALARQDGVAVKNNLIDAKMDMSNVKQRVTDTGGFMQIPQTQIDLSDGVLKQNAGWTGDNLLY